MQSQIGALQLNQAAIARANPPVFVAVQAASPAPVAIQTPAPVQAAPVQAAAVQPALKMVLTPRIADIKMIDPAVSVRISDIPFVTTGLERSKLTAPIAPAGDVSDTAMFEDPKDATIKYFVMGYRVGEVSTTSGRQFSVRLVAKEQHWELSIALAKAAPDAILRSVPGARELPHQISLLLRYKQFVNAQPAAVAELAFTQTTIEGDVVRATLAIETLSKRDEIYHAITDPKFDCALIVRRMMKVAIPVPATSTPPSAPTSLKLVAAQPTATNAMMARRVIMDHEPILVHETVKIPPVPTPPPPPPPSPPLYRETDRVLDLSLPFTFDPNLHPYILQDAGVAVGSASQGLIRRQIEVNGQQHICYQDGGEPNVFFYLPDTFKIARRPAPPHEPILSIHFDSVDGSQEKMRVACTYCAVPVVNRDRLTSMLPELKRHMASLGASGSVVLKPLLPHPSKINLRLAYPGADITGGPFELRPKAAVDLRAGIVDVVPMTIDQFRAVYDALFSTTGPTFTGVVGFDMGGTGEEVRFGLRLHDTAEPFAGWTANREGGDAIVSVTNEVESALRLRHIDAIVQDGNDASVKPLDVIDGAYPIVVAQAATTRFRLPGLAAGTITDLDFSDVESVPDKLKLYDIILDPSSTAAYLRPIKVRTFAETFEPSGSAPEQKVRSIVVDFEGGIGVELSPAQLEVADVNVPVPLAAFITGQSNDLTYRYKLTVERLSGATTDADWRTGDSAVLTARA